jgi:endonuclease/exonuclease/phosphatase family metal-dependent hydrolase
MQTLHIATYNIHKGFSQFNRRVVLHELRERLRELNADIVFLQEVQGEHNSHGLRHLDYPAGPQHEFIAAEIWPHSAYGKNSTYTAGHHGNAILSAIVEQRHFRTSFRKSRHVACRDRRRVGQ